MKWENLFNGCPPLVIKRSGRLLPAFFGVSQDFDLWLHNLKVARVVVFLYLSVQGNHLARLEALSQVGSVEPDAFQLRPPLARSHLKNRHAPRAKEAGIAHL